MKLKIEGKDDSDPTLTFSLSGAEFNKEQVTLSARVDNSPSVNHLLWVSPNGTIHIHREAMERVGLKINYYT